MIAVRVEDVTFDLGPYALSNYRLLTAYLSLSLSLSDDNRGWLKLEEGRESAKLRREVGNTTNTRELVAKRSIAAERPGRQTILKDEYYCRGRGLEEVK